MSVVRISIAGGITTEADVLMVLLYAPGTAQNVGAPIKGVTRVQKLMFLLWKEGHFMDHVPNLYRFHADDLGPCMDELYDSLEFFAAVDLVRVREVPCGNDFEDAEESAVAKDFGYPRAPTGLRKDFSLSPSGLAVGKQMFDSLGEREQECLTLIKKKYDELPFWDLLRYVFKKYPAYAAKSIIPI
jgi:hypothetical protein